MEEKLIIAVAGFPIIYDMTLFAYRDKLEKNEAWDKVAEIVGVSADDCKKKWKSLRDMFKKERKKEKDRQRSGAGASSVRPWLYSAVMGFLNPFMEDRPTSTNMGGGEVLDDSGHWPEDSDTATTGHSQAQEQTPQLQAQEQVPQLQASDNTPVQRASQPTQRRERPHTSDFEERLLTALEAVSNRPVPVPSPSPPPQHPPKDSDSYFFKTLQEDFKTLSLRTRQDLKFEMHRLVYEAKCREVDPWAEGDGVQLTTL
ncbi:uncharacterized protein LOC117943446 [Etheostoma cragini]|uniref:uncharacterized protein LOC117943446 n=1 Tax=Etheostoma cragini TaxID=417921 RepID=UPI00155E17EE|nr:uncharacterized protein LOC117943446 [Etheostoma cragini]